MKVSQYRLPYCDVVTGALGTAGIVIGLDAEAGTITVGIGGVAPGTGVEAGIGSVGIVGVTPGMGSVVGGTVATGVCGGQAHTLSTGLDSEASFTCTSSFTLPVSASIGTI